MRRICVKKLRHECRHLSPSSLLFLQCVVSCCVMLWALLSSLLFLFVWPHLFIVVSRVASSILLVNCFRRERREKDALYVNYIKLQQGWMDGGMEMGLKSENETLLGVLVETITYRSSWWCARCCV